MSFRETPEAEGPKFEAEGREQGKDSWGGAASPLPTS